MPVSVSVGRLRLPNRYRARYRLFLFFPGNGQRSRTITSTSTRTIEEVMGGHAIGEERAESPGSGGALPYLTRSPSIAYRALTLALTLTLL